jgi:hypothetical protein
MSGTHYLPLGPTTTVSSGTALSPDMCGTVQPSGTIYVVRICRRVLRCRCPALRVPFGRRLGSFESGYG